MYKQILYRLCGLLKQTTVIVACILLFSNITGCGQSDKTKILEQYKYEDNSNILTVNVNKKLDPWLKEGLKCYGIIMVCDLTGKPLRIKEVNVQVVSIQPESIKMRALEDVVINRTIECKKVSFKKGDSWNEEYGEIFKTREEAIKYIDINYPGLRIK